MEPTTGRRAAEVPATQLCGVDRPYSLAYDGLLQQRKNTLTHGNLTLATERSISAQLYRLKEQAAQTALIALRDFQSLLHYERDHLSSSATKDNWASNKLPLAHQKVIELDQHVAAIDAIIEQVVQP
uniref:ORFY protein n=1 Tax=Cacao swollen shoot Togo A virus TaxID=1960254 RepID=A0A2H4U908_9VIRU|nr:ORFY protein [Cacao swollen shoot Togo A virus]